MTQYDSGSATARTTLRLGHDAEGNRRAVLTRLMRVTIPAP